MHPADIAAFLKKAKISQAQIARSLNVSNTAVSEVVLGASRSARIEQEIAKRLGVTPADLWPQHYGEPVTGAPEPIAPYRRGVGITMQKAEEQLIDLWRRMGFDEQQEAMRVMRALAEGSPPDAKPGSEGIAGMRGNVTASGDSSVAVGRDAIGVQIGKNLGQVNSGSNVFNRGKK